LQGIYFKNELKKAYANGKDVYAVIVANDGCSGSRSSMIKFKYDNHIYIKRIYKDYCNSQIGDKVLMRYDKKSDNLLYVGEDVEEELAISYLLLIVGVAFAVIGWKKK